MHDWIRYKNYTGADEHGNQPEQNRTTGRPVQQGGSSRTTTLSAVVPAQRAGIHNCTLQLRSLWSTPSLKAHPRAPWTAGKERRYPHQPQLKGRSSWYLSNERSRSNSQQQKIHNFFKKAMGITAKFNRQLLASNFVQCSHHASARKKVFFINRRKPRTI